MSFGLAKVFLMTPVRSYPVGFSAPFFPNQEENFSDY
jgi:hypothetical protein